MIKPDYYNMSKPKAVKELRLRLKDIAVSYVETMPPSMTKGHLK